jgi:hypothetical protein
MLCEQSIEARRCAVSKEAWIGIAVVVGLIALLTLYGVIRLGKRLFATRRMLGDLGTGGKIAFYGSLLYTFFPIDILPDPIYLDDMAVMGGALFYLTRLAHKRGLLRLPGRGGGTAVAGRPVVRPTGPRR